MHRALLGLGPIIKGAAVEDFVLFDKALAKLKTLRSDLDAKTIVDQVYKISACDMRRSARLVMEDCSQLALEGEKMPWE